VNVGKLVSGELKKNRTDGTGEIHWRNKKYTHFQLQTLRERGILGELDLEEVLKTI
jgi:hypothetical protein